MEYKYNCELCDYDTNKTSSYKKHMNSTKHKMNQKDSNNKNNANNTYKCTYCNKIMSKHNKTRHDESCKEKYNMKESIKQELKQEVQQEEHDKNVSSNTTLIQLFEEFIKYINNTNINNSNNNNQINNFTNLNVNYILKNFTDPYTLSECLSIPLTEEEKLKLETDPAIVCCEKFVKARCIDNIALEKRPFHVVDMARNKFIVCCENKENGGKDWIISDGTHITKMAIPIINKEYIKANKTKDINKINKINTDIHELNTGSKRLIDSFLKASILKNNVRMRTPDNNTLTRVLNEKIPNKMAPNWTMSKQKTVWKISNEKVSNDKTSNNKTLNEKIPNDSPNKSDSDSSDSYFDYDMSDYE